MRPINPMSPLYHGNHPIWMFGKRRGFPPVGGKLQRLINEVRAECHQILDGFADGSIFGLPPKADLTEQLEDVT